MKKQNFTLRSPLIGCSLLVYFLLNSCHFNSQYINRESDKADAEQVTELLFTLIQEKRYEEVNDLFSQEVYKVTPKEKILDSFKFTQSKLGNLLTTRLENWETKILTGSDPSSNYALVYENKYEKFDAQEVFRLKKEADGKIRITSYRINSSGFKE